VNAGIHLTANGLRSNLPRGGATPEGKKELTGFQTGIRESAQSWHELLTDIKARGLSAAPGIAVGPSRGLPCKPLPGNGRGSGVLERAGPRVSRHEASALPGAQGEERAERLFPRQMAAAVKSDPDDIQHAETRSAAETAPELFTEKYKLRYEKGAICLTKDREAMLAFFDFPADHWGHLRTSNPIERVFATVRHRTVRTKGALSQKTAKLTVFTLIQAASKNGCASKAETSCQKSSKVSKSTTVSKRPTTP